MVCGALGHPAAHISLISEEMEDSPMKLTLHVEGPPDHVVVAVVVLAAIVTALGWALQ